MRQRSPDPTRSHAGASAHLILAIALISLGAPSGPALASVTESSKAAHPLLTLGGAQADDDPNIRSRFRDATHTDGFVDIEGTDRRELLRRVSDPPPSSDAPRLEYEAADCSDVDVSAGQSHWLCDLTPEERHDALECHDDQTTSNPRYVRSRPVGGTEADWTAWEWTGTFSCVDPEEPTTAEIVTILERDFADLPIPPSPVRIQPDRDWTYVNLDTIVMTDPDPATLATTVLGTPVEVKVTPVSFSWDFGDGSTPLVTTDPGKPYPHHTVAYAYPQTGEYPIALTTTWAGEFRIAGSNPWQPIAGTTTTTTTRDPLTLTERRTRLGVDP